MRRDSGYDPVGSCIFCVGTETDGSEQLTDEHILAYSLGGNVVLPEATCNRHQEITRGIDEYIALETLKVYRHTHNLPSRTKTGRQPYYKISVFNEFTGITYFLEIPASEFPGVYISPKLTLPGLLSGDHSYPPTCDLEVHGDRFEQLNAKFPPGATTSVESGEFHNNEFARMLAKVAHTYLSAEMGHGNFHPVLLETIEGSAPNPWLYVGGFSPSLPQERQGFSVREYDLDEIRYFVVSISITALPGIPRYQVVAGIAKDPLPYPERLHKNVEAQRSGIRAEREARAKALGMYGTASKKKVKLQLRELQTRVNREIEEG